MCALWAHKQTPCAETVCERGALTNPRPRASKSKGVREEKREEKKSNSNKRIKEKVKGETRKEK